MPNMHLGVASSILDWPSWQVGEIRKRPIHPGAAHLGAEDMAIVRHGTTRLGQQQPLHKIALSLSRAKAGVSYGEQWTVVSDAVATRFDFAKDSPHSVYRELTN